MEYPISRAALSHITSRFNRDFEPTQSITLELNNGECPEELWDELRLWCRRHSTERWKQMVRGVRGIIAMGFESALDAAMFRASALNDCRNLIDANNRRRRAAMRRASR